MSVIVANLTYYERTTSIEVTVPGAAQDGDVLLIIDLAHGEGLGGSASQRLRPPDPGNWENAHLGTEQSLGVLTLLARRWTPSIGNSIQLASTTSSRRLVGLALLRGIDTEWIVLHRTNVGTSVVAPAVTAPAEGDLLVFAGTRSPSVVPPGGVPMSTPPGMSRQADFQESLVLLRGLIAATVVPPGSTGERETSWEPDPVAGAWGVSVFFPYSTDPRRRVRASVSEDAGSLFQATQAVAVELGISEAFEYGTDLGGGLRAFREALTPELVALRYYAVPTRNQEMLSTVEGETNLGRLAHTIAPRIFTRGTSIPGNDGGVVTAQQAIQHVVNRWSSEHPWLVFEPIPDLRLLVPEAVNAPRQYYLDNPTAGVLTTSNVVIEQEGNDRRTMREVLDEWLQVFPGTIVRQTSAGTIELVPRVGPDAPDSAALTLTWRDLARMSDGENDPRGIYNRARVTSQGWEWSEESPLMPPSWLLSTTGLQRNVLAAEEVLPVAREETWPNSIILFPVLSDDATPVTVDIGITAYGSWSATASTNFSVEGTTSDQFTLARGQRRNVTITHNTRGANYTSRWRVERLASPAPDALYVTPLDVIPGAYSPFGTTYVAYVLELDATGTGWAKSNETIVGEYGRPGDELPAEGGGNAIEQSRALFGERTAEIRSTIFQLDNPQAEAVAQSYVLHNINPRTVRDVQQSPWDRYPVKFDHIGRYVELPNGEVAVVENRSYSDSFAPRASAMMSTFTATVSHSVIDTSTQYLFNSDGSYWENDDGTISEVL